MNEKGEVTKARHEEGAFDVDKAWLSGRGSYCGSEG